MFLHHITVLVCKLWASFFLLQVLLSPPIVVYSPRVLPVYVYDSHADCGQNVRYALHICLIMFVVEYLSQLSTPSVSKYPF